MNCPTHNRILRRTKWTPPVGIDPRMHRFYCSQCTEYWYKAPKNGLKRWEEIQLTIVGGA